MCLDYITIVNISPYINYQKVAASYSKATIYFDKFFGLFCTLSQVESHFHGDCVALRLMCGDANRSTLSGITL